MKAIVVFLVSLAALGAFAGVTHDALTGFLVVVATVVGGVIGIGVAQLLWLKIPAKSVRNHI